MLTQKKVVLVMLLSLTALAGCGGCDDAPVADVRPHDMTIHGHTRTDNKNIFIIKFEFFLFKIE